MYVSRLFLQSVLYKSVFLVFNMVIIKIMFYQMSLTRNDYMILTRDTLAKKFMQLI